MYLSAIDEATLIAATGPALQRAGVGSVKILAYDHNWDRPEYPLYILGNDSSSPWVAGSAFHCYAGDVSAQSKVHELYPEREIHMTECSGGDWAPEFWSTLVWNVLYVGSTINWGQSINHWNLALDSNGMYDVATVSHIARCHAVCRR